MIPDKERVYRILLLEDDLNALAEIFKCLGNLKDKAVAKRYMLDFSVTTLPESTQVKKYINNEIKQKFDIVLLDRDTKDKKSYHILNLDKFDKGKIIAISSVPKYNKDLEKQGVTITVFKDYKNLSDFANEVVIKIQNILNIPNF